MPAQKHPGFEFNYDLKTELKSIKAHLHKRKVPKKRAGKLLLATWNLCNLGDKGQMRSKKALRLMAAIIRPFDLIAVQEIKDDFHQFVELVGLLPKSYRFLMTDKAGNSERLAYIYDSHRVELRELIAELVLLPRERPSLTFKKSKRSKVTFKEKFVGFNRNPYICSFKAGKFDFSLVNVHIYYGAASGKKFRRRILEVYALGKWAYKRVTKKKEITYDTDIILLGDFNVPTQSIEDRVMNKLLKFGMVPSIYSSKSGTNLKGTKQYDQIVFAPSLDKAYIEQNTGVFDFDMALFNGLWKTTQPPNARRSEADFHQFIRYHISDHRLLWSVMNTK